MTRSQRKWLLLLRRMGDGGITPGHKAVLPQTKRACEARGWSETVRGKFGLAVMRITPAGRAALEASDEQ